jgi:hypothetical protein
MTPNRRGAYYAPTRPEPGDELQSERTIVGNMLKHFGAKDEIESTGRRRFGREPGPRFPGLRPRCGDRLDRRVIADHHGSGLCEGDGQLAIAATHVQDPPTLRGIATEEHAVPPQKSSIRHVASGMVAR